MGPNFYRVVPGAISIPVPYSETWKYAETFLIWLQGGRKALHPKIFSGRGVFISSELFDTVRNRAALLETVRPC